MRTVQACQQNRLAIMNPNKAKSFSAANVPAVAKLGHRRRGKRGTANKKHKAIRARSRLEELTLGAFNVRTAAVNGVNGISTTSTPC